jgi:long-subunit fatty acid transport protein
MAFANVSQRTFTQIVPNEGERQDLDAVAQVKAKDPFAFHFGLGLQYDLDPIEFGLNYNSQVRFDLKGAADINLGSLGSTVQVMPLPDDQVQCATGGQPGAIKTCIDLIIPQSLTVGSRWVFRDDARAERGDIEFDVRWEDWSAASEIEATLDGQALNMPLGKSRIRNGLKDSFGFRLGGSRIFRHTSHNLVARGGLGYDTESAPITWTRVSQDGAPKITLTSGLGVDFESWRVDFGVSYVAVPIRRVNDEPIEPTTPQADRVQPDVPSGGLGGAETPYNPFNAGYYKRSYLMASMGFSYRF